MMFRDIEAGATLALAEQRLDHAREAAAAMATADELAKAWPNVNVAQNNARPDFGEDWLDTLMGNFLLREAHTSAGGK